MGCIIIGLFIILYKVLLANAVFHETEFNKGWLEYIGEETSEFHDIPLEWATNSTVPSWITGSYMKNGPAQRSFPGGDRYYSNYLDGWAKLHKFSFRDGKVLFSGKMLESWNYLSCQQAGQITPTITLGPVRPNDWTTMEMFEGMINDYDNTNVLTYKLGPDSSPGGEFFATTDYVHAYQFDPQSLEVIRRVSMSPLTLNGLTLGGTSHWRRDITSHDFFTYFTSFNPLTFMYELALWRIGDTWEEKSRVASISLPYMPYIHQFSTTKDYAVIVLYPIALDFARVALELNFHPMETMVPVDGPTRFFLIELESGQVIDGFESQDPSIQFAAHHINAYQENNQIVLDVCASPFDVMVDELDIDVMKNWEEKGEKKNMAKRIRLNLETKEVDVADYENALNNDLINAFDFPFINHQYNGIKHRYVYGWVRVDNWRQTLIKKDLADTRNDKLWSLPSNYPGEVIFIPNPEGVSEDDGVLVTVVFNGSSKRSYLLLLDAVDLKEINRAYLPYMVPMSFHGNWFPNLA